MKWFRISNKVKNLDKDGSYYAKERFTIKENAKDASLSSQAKHEIYTDGYCFEKVKYNRTLIKDYALIRYLIYFIECFIQMLVSWVFSYQMGATEIVIQNIIYV